MEKLCEKKIVDIFEELSKRYLDEYSDVAEYKACLEEEKSKITNLNVKNNLVSIIRHPIKFARLRRIDRISRNFDSLVNSSLISFSGMNSDLAFDLTEALMYRKPAAIINFMDENKIKRKVFSTK